MVGEIRDLETAEISVKAAQTGHLVLSTLHTNDAPSTLERLKNMGVAPFNIASSVIMITAQRLARRLCTCKKPIDIPIEALMSAGFTERTSTAAGSLTAPSWLRALQGQWLQGTARHLPGDADLRGDRTYNHDERQLDGHCCPGPAEGVSDLRQSGLLKVKQGVTSLTEVLACTNE
jgi:type IV pilus assembly protein PilB